MRLAKFAVTKTTLLALLLLAASCTRQPEPFDYTPVDEVKSGPGLLSGEDGVFTIYEENGNAAPGPRDEGAEVPCEVSAPPGK